MRTAQCTFRRPIRSSAGVVATGLGADYVAGREQQPTTLQTCDVDRELLQRCPDGPHEARLTFSTLA